MADYKILGAALRSWEGGFANDPDDAGGATMRGITIATYTSYRKKKGLPSPTVADLKAMTDAEWWEVFKTMYWDVWQADKIKSQAVANICVNWGWASGTITAIKAVQKALGVVADGSVGPVTLAALNKAHKTYEYRFVFNRIKAERAAQLLSVAKKGNNAKFIDGWLRKWEGFHYDRIYKADGSDIVW